jgi:molecular chaperone DnaK (HSP70)
MPEPILAVDFGTSTSAAILVTDAGEQLITERSGTGQTWPSAVCLDGTELRVGTEADNLKRVRADKYRAQFKLELGREAAVDLGGHEFTVQALVTAVLTAIKAAAERAAGEPVTRVVLTVPGSYEEGDVRRALMVDAATEAGFDVVELLPEPVAAALAPVAGPPVPGNSLILVYDLGGGTFDTALIRIGRLSNEVLRYAAIDHGSGGRDIDSAHAAEDATVLSGDWLITSAEASPESLIDPVKVFQLPQGSDVNCVTFSPDGLVRHRQ